MKFTAANQKITPRHLSLRAIIYIRQSSVRQVIEHTGSVAYQRSLRDLARHHGWADESIIELDVDQGMSGTEVAGRKGFQWLRQQIFDGRVGAVYCWEASRLARDSSAFAQLIKLCAVSNTLIIDEKGVYDPNNLNDGFFLGVMGVLSETEGRRIADRAIAGQRVKATAGELHVLAPTGYVRNDKGKLVMDPDEQVQNAIHLLFSTFEEFGSISQVLKHYNRKGILFPTRQRGKGKEPPVIWKELTANRASYVLHNPAYAGIYAYGRTRLIGQMVSAETTERTKKKVRLGLDSDDVILIRDAHEAYITPEKFEQNQQRLKDNTYSFSDGSSGAVRNGPALLQGRLKCTECGRAMHPRYGVLNGKKLGGYLCSSGRRELGKPNCIFISAPRLDRAITQAMFEALSPAQLQMTLRALEEPRREMKEGIEGQLNAIKRASDQADEAKRKYEAISPEYKLVAEEYLKEYEKKLNVVRQLKAEHSRKLKASTITLSDDMRRSILALSRDVRRVWESDTVTFAERKNVLRHLISKVYVTRPENSKCLDVVIHWATGASTSIVVKHGRCLDPGAVELMRKLAPDHTIPQIIEKLHQAGYKPVQAERFSRSSVYFCFRAYGIKNYCLARPSLSENGPRGDGRYSARETAMMLNRSKATVIRLCRKGVLDAVRDTAGGPYWIKISQEQITKLRKSK